MNKIKLPTLDRLENRYLSKVLVLVMDLVLSVSATAIAVALAYLVFSSGSTLFGQARQFVLVALGASLAGSLLAFVFTRTFRVIIRHLAIRDLGRFVFAVVIKGLVMLCVLALAGFMSSAVALLVLFDIMLTILLLISARLSMILVWSHYNSRIQEKYKYKRVLVYGSSPKSVATIVRLQTSPHYKIVGFLSEVAEGRTIEGLPVFTFKTMEDLARTLVSARIDAVLFATERDAQSEENRLIKLCSEKGIGCLITPTVDEVQEGEVIMKPREVKVEDLLGRDEIKISLDAVEKYFAGRTVMVTGAAGSIGSELCRQLAGFGVGKLVLFDNAETPMHNLRLELEDRFPELDFVPIIGDVRQAPRLDFAFRTHHPEVVFHAAAYKHVPLMEENPCEAVLVNVYGSRNVADKCLEYGVEKMVMISTDKAVNPTNIMGCTKRLAEIYVQSLGLAVERGTRTGTTRFVTTRFGNVLGSNGSVIPRFKAQIAKGGPVTVTHPDINRFFMTIPEACRLVMEAATMSDGNQIFVFDMGKPVKIDDLARRMIRLAGFVPDKDIKVEYTGLRPGEKLYEEVLANDENTMPAFHDRIRIAKVREYDYAVADKVTRELADLSQKVEIPDMVRLMKRTVPEYKSAGSKYAEIDEELARESIEKIKYKN